MKRLALCLFALLPGCAAPTTLWYRAGAPVAAADSALAACTARASRAVPAALQTLYTPLQVRRVRVCDAAGNCELEIETEGGDPYVADINADRRAQAIGQCMADAGYTPVTLPPCPPEVARAAPPGNTTTLPRLTPQSCAVPRDGGGVRIVTRG